MAPAVFNTDVAEHLGQAGSIPVRLRHSTLTMMSALPATAAATDSPVPTGVLGIADAVRDGRCTATVIAEALVVASHRAGDGLLTVDPDPVRAAAAALDRRADRFALPLAGVPVVVEDGISSAGRGDEPVRRLRAAGALVAGRARTPEFDLGPDDSPGGRATAAAVAAGTVPLGVGIDADGTLRAAAAAHGLAALKPGRRVLPLPPIAERRWSGLAETTVVAGSTADLRVAFDVLAAPARRPGDASGAPAAPAPAPVASLVCSLRTGRSRNADIAAAAGLRAAIRMFDASGVRLVAADPPYRAVLPVHGARRREAGLARRIDDLDLDPALLPRDVRSALRRGRRVRRLGGLRPATPASWRQRLVGWLDESGAEAGLLPAPAGPAGAGSTGLGAWNLAGLPSLITPVRRVSGAVCVQLVGRPGSERTLLATAALLAGG